MIRARLLAGSGGVLVLAGWAGKQFGWPPQLLHYDRSIIALGTGLGLLGVGLIQKSQQHKVIDDALNLKKNKG